MPPTFAATYEASPQRIAIVRSQMADLARECGLPESTVADVRLAVSEATTNALVHGYRGEPGTIQVEATVDDGGLTIAVRDAGGGLRPRADSPGLGLGLPVIAAVADRLDVEDARPGTRLRFSFACPA